MEPSFQLTSTFQAYPNSLSPSGPLHSASRFAGLLAADIDAVMALREEAAKLAVKLNNGEPGILAGPDAPGSRLARETTAPDGTIPLWGQTGSFIITVNAMRVRIDMDGIFGIGARYMPWMNFSARAVDWEKPFLSETGYRSFMGLYAKLVPDLTPGIFAEEAISGYVKTSLKGKLAPIQQRYSKPLSRSA